MVDLEGSRSSVVPGTLGFLVLPPVPSPKTALVVSLFLSLPPLGISFGFFNLSVYLATRSHSLLPFLSILIAAGGRGVV